MAMLMAELAEALQRPAVQEERAVNKPGPPRSEDDVIWKSLFVLALARA